MKYQIIIKYPSGYKYKKTVEAKNLEDAICIAETVRAERNQHSFFGKNECVVENITKVSEKPQTQYQVKFYKDPNIKNWAESEYAWSERPCDSNMNMCAVDKNGCIVGYASEYYWTWCDVQEVETVSATEAMNHFIRKLKVNKE